MQLVRPHSGARMSGSRQKRYGEIQTEATGLINRQKPFGYGSMKGYTRLHD
jgi:hypothetical protein